MSRSRASKVTIGPSVRFSPRWDWILRIENYLRGPVSEVLSALRERPAIRGEIVLLLDGTLIRTAAQPTHQSLADEVSHLIRSGLSEKDALKQVAKCRGLGKSEAYREWQRAKGKTADK